MEDLTQIELPSLIDLLSERTASYMTMLRNGATKEQFDLCKEEIQKIQQEVQLRKKNSSVTNISTADISFTQDTSS